MSRPSLVTRFFSEPRPYTGVELRPHFLLSELGLRGSAIGAFVGPCRVATEHLVDWEDRLAADRIEAKQMVHFIGEFFGMGLREGVQFQRLMMSILGDSFAQVGIRSGARAEIQASPVSRSGDDLFCKERKMSVSIVTASPVSILLHTGINVDPAGAPVPAIGLTEMGVDPQVWVPQVLESIVEEWEGMEWACAKVRPVM